MLTSESANISFVSCVSLFFKQNLLRWNILEMFLLKNCQSFYETFLIFPLNNDLDVVWHLENISLKGFEKNDSSESSRLMLCSSIFYSFIKHFKVSLFLMIYLTR